MPYIYAIIYYLLVFPSAYALIGNPEDIIPNIDTDGKLISFTTPTSMISSIIAYAIGIAGILGVIGITWGGIQMILAIGDDEKMKKGRYMVIYSIIGVVVAGLAYSVVQIIGNIKI